MRLPKVIAVFAWLFGITLLGAWAHHALTPLATRGAVKAWAPDVYPGGFQLLLSAGWILYLLPGVVLLQWFASRRVPSLAGSVALGLCGGFIALVFLCYGVLLAMPVISLGVYAK